MGPLRLLLPAFLASACLATTTPSPSPLSIPDTEARPSAAPTPTIVPQASATLQPAPSAAPSPAATPRPTSAPSSTGSRVVVRRLGIDVPLIAGSLAHFAQGASASSVPDNVALHLPGTALPGRPGNAFIYGHARAGAFLPLWGARVGDVVLVTKGPVTYEYVVSQVAARVDAADASWLGQAGPERVTLQTSTGPTAREPRFIVVATRTR